MAQAIGEVERQNCSLLKSRSLQIANLEGKNWRTELITWLAAYISKQPQVPHLDGWSGDEDEVLELRRETIELPRQEVLDREWSNNLRGKTNADTRRAAKIKGP